MKSTSENSSVTNSAVRRSLRFVRAVACLFLSLLVSFSVAAQNKFEEQKISDVTISFEGTDKDVSAAEQFRLIAKTAVGDRYSTVKIREAIDAIYSSKKIISARVEAEKTPSGDVRLRFIIKRKTQAERIYFRIGATTGEAVTEEELLLKLNLINAGTEVTEQTLQSNADLIQGYLRERGFYNAEVSYSQQVLGNENRVAVTFQVTPNVQSKVDVFDIKIAGFELDKVKKLLKLQPGSMFSRSRLIEDVDRIRAAILKQSFLAPNLEEPMVTFDAERNAISVELTGEIGSKVKVTVDVEKEKIDEKTQERLLPIKRQGTLEFSAIREGARRLRNYYQEKGYFFVEVEELCSVSPVFPPDELNPVENNSVRLCEALSGADLENRDVAVNYSVNLNRQLRLKDIRIEGTKRVTIPEIISILDTQQASLIGLIPRLGYGRGYTSSEILDDDRQRIEAIMRELGYRNSRVKVKQGASLDGENLIITFVIEEGVATKISDIEINGNNVFADEKLMKELPQLINKNYSRARARNGAQKISDFYTNAGYFDADINFSIVDLPVDPTTGEERVKIIYDVEKEGRKVLINRILVNGNDQTKIDAILTAIDLKSDHVLRSTEIFSSEQNLYATDAFRRVEIKQEPAGETPTGEAQRDVIINLEEQKPRLMDYGGGFSSEYGVNGFFSIRHFNLFGKLQQGGARISWSRAQQLVQFDFLNPRFIRDGKGRFAPLSISAQYQRDSTVTRFFRSAFDQGTFGIVQRIDAQGNPIDQFGAQTGDPTINRFTLTAETNRTLSKKDRSLIFLRYRYEDVRLYNVESLLISELLIPDRRVRTSGFGVTYVRDTRENCSRKYSLLELISKGELGDPCRYNPTDPTKGSNLTLEYNFSTPALGANIGFQKFQANYQTYYQAAKLNNTVFAGRAVLGLGAVFSRNQVFTGNLAELNGSLPISERFFAGGSTTLRGFEFESAGPRIVITPQGTFRNSKGEIVTLSPFTVPFGGNGLAIVNLEARIPLTESLQAVPFYDGGNVFNRVGDIFKPLQSATGNVFKDNLRATWSNTVGLGLRIKTPFGGSVAIDYGYLLNPPRFIIPQNAPPDGIFQPKRGHLHFRFAQSF
jgi:outer membrane protein assembly complex protein YaeT